MAKVFHVIPYQYWQSIRKEKTDNYSPDSLKSDGFIHLCKADQLNDVISNFFSKSLSIVILRVDENKLGDQLVYEAPIEAPNSGMLYPHFYNSISLSEIEKVFYVQRTSDVEKFEIPSNILR